jgi:hypothetical protein
MSIKSQSIGALFLALVVILALNPKIINNIYENVLGRIFLICVVIFFSINNATLGLLVVLVIITALNQFGSFTEGFEPNQGEKEGQSVLTKGVKLNMNKLKKKISNLKEEKEDGTTGVNLQDLRNTTMAKDSNTIQVDKNMNSSEEVSPSTSSMLNPSLKENFSSLR